MSDCQREIATINRKVDDLYVMVERLSQQIDELLLNIQHKAVSDAEQFERVLQIQPHPLPQHNNVDEAMRHKDILLDSRDWENPTAVEKENSLSSDLQIRRLTAQVTAAYNRIAALEEQLLTRRIRTESGRV
ncbi:hypothetical protein [Lusitaniella coriacea]|uniref:hypothetical protein n=1 Tax=Lusitaniella coriacea TaxID=1983105 RepID=UPI003CEA785C